MDDKSLEHLIADSIFNNEGWKFSYSNAFNLGHEILKTLRAQDGLKNLACENLPDVSLLPSKQGNEGETRASFPACSASQEADMLPCPFCGGKPYNQFFSCNVPGMEDCGYWGVGCSNCDYGFDNEDTVEELIKHWNKRAR